MLKNGDFGLFLEFGDLGRIFYGGRNFYGPPKIFLSPKYDQEQFYFLFCIDISKTF